MAAGNTVGAMYVKVVADTSGLKRQITRAAKEDGDDAGEIFGVEFERALEKRLGKIQLDRAFEGQFDKMGHDLATKIAAGQAKGTENLTISKNLSAEVKKAVRAMGLNWDEMGDELQGDILHAVAGGFERGFKDAEKSAAKSKATIGHLLSDVGKDISFGKALDNLVKDIATKVPDDVRQAIESGQANVKWTFAAEAKKEIDKIAKAFDVSAADIEKTIRARIPAAFNAAGREAEKQAAKASKALGGVKIRPLTDLIDDDAFLREVNNVANTVEKVLPRRMRSALRKGTKVDWDFDAQIAPHIRSLAQKFQISFRDASRMVQRDITRGLVTPMSKMDNMVGKIYRSLRRVGSGGIFDGLTTALGAVILMAFKIGSAFFSVFTKVVNIVGTVMETIGEGIKGVTENMSGLGKIANKVGEKMVGIGGGLAETVASAPAAIVAVIGLVAVMASLVLVLGAVAQAISAVIAGVVILGAAIYHTIALAALFAPIVGALVVGFGGMFVGGMDAAKAVMALGKAMMETDPKKRAAAMKQYREELKKLGPNAREAVQALEPLIESFKGLKKRAGEALFEGMAKSLGKAKPLIDAVSDGLVLVAGAVGDVIDGFLELGGSASFMESFKGMWESSASLIRHVGNAARDVFAGLTSFFDTISPVTEKFATAIETIAANFRKWTESESGRASILDFFETAYDIGSQVWDIVKELAGAFGDLFTADATQNATKDFLTWLLEQVQRFRDWINEVSENGKLEEWFNNAKEAAKILWTVMGFLVEAFKALLTPSALNTLKLVGLLFMAWVGSIVMVINVVGFLIGILVGGFKLAKGVILTVWYAILFVKDAIVAVWRKFGELKSQGKSTFDAIKGAITAAKDAVQRFIDRIKNIHWPKPPEWVRKLWPFASGGVVMGPTRALVGEAGPEAIIPLTRPLSQVDPSVRGMAALMRGQTKTFPGATGASRVTTNYWQITTPGADARVVAAQVMNRMAVAAG